MPAASKIKYRAKIGQLPALKTYYIEVPKTIIAKLGGTFKIRLHVTVNRKVTYQTGMMALGQGRGYLALSTARMKQAGANPNSMLDVELKKDTSKFGMAMPDELKELLRQDSEGKKRFEMLNPAKQRYILYYVNGVKNPELRLERAMLLIGNLKLCAPGKETFRRMLGLPDRT